MNAARKPRPVTPLKRLRLARGMTVQVLAESIGVAHSTILRMEWGEMKSTVLAEKIADYFGRDFINEIHLLYPERFPA